VRITRDGILAGLAWIIVFGGGHVLAQSNAYLQQRDPYALMERVTVGDMTGEVLPPGPVVGPNGTALPLAPHAAPQNGDVLLPGAPPAGPACYVCGRGDCNPPLSYVSQGVRVLQRTKTPDDLVGFQLFPNSQFFSQLEPVLGVRGLDYGIAAGYTITFGRYLGRDAANRDDFGEFTYWGMNSWSDTVNASSANRLSVGNLPADVLARLPAGTSSVSFGGLFSKYSPSNLLYDSPVGGFNRADHQSLFVRSDIHSFEWNLRLEPRGRADRLVGLPNGQWRRECQQGKYISYMVGPRFLLLNESMEFHGEGRFDAFDAAGHLLSSRRNTGDYGIFTHNNLLGVQCGADISFRHCRWDWGVRGKVGPYVNFAEQSSHSVTNAFGDPYATDAVDIHTTDRRDQVALIGEVGFYGDYRIRQNIVLHGAWDFMWITGLAQAPGQLNFHANPTGDVVATGDMLVQGLTFQLEVKW
jgi:hypothetical protein